MYCRLTTMDMSTYTSNIGCVSDNIVCFSEASEEPEDLDSWGCKF